MNLFIETIAVIASMLFSQHAFSRDALLDATIKEIKVTTISPSVLQQLESVSPDDRKSLDAAIHTGNQFMPQYFSFNAFDSNPENRDWEIEVEPLMRLSREQWDEKYRNKPERRTIQEGNYFSNLFKKNEAHTTRLTCPHISIISVKKNNDGSTLVYRAISVGTLINYQGDLYDFNLDNSGAVYDVSIDLDQYTSLVTKVTPSDIWMTWSYTKPIAIMQRLLGNPSFFAGNTSKEHLTEMVKTYKNTIQKINTTVKSVCK